VRDAMDGEGPAKKVVGKVRMKKKTYEGNGLVPYFTRKKLFAKKNARGEKKTIRRGGVERHRIQKKKK